jgi:hypothetical protein
MSTNTVTATTSSSSTSSATLTQGAFKIATWSHVLAVLGVIGSIAVSFASNQPLLYAVFGQQKGAIFTLTAIAVSHAATTITAYGDSIGTVASSVSVPSLSAPSVSISTITPPSEAGASTMSITTTEGPKLT